MSAGPSLSWTDAALGGAQELPHARGGAATAAWTYASQDVLFMFGGCSEVACFDDLQRHDQKSGRWAVQQAAGKPPLRRKGHTLTLLGPAWAQQLVVFGGWGGDGPLPNSLKAFTLATSSWDVVPLGGTPPAPRWAHTATAVAQSRMLVFGGAGVLPNQYYNDVYSFNLEDQQWTRMHPGGDGSSGRLLPSARMGHSATLIGEALLVFGGYTTEQRGSRSIRVATNELWALDLRGEGDSRTASPDADRGVRWIKIPTIGHAPAARGFHATVQSPHGANLFMFGGCDEVEGACFNDAYMLDTTNANGMRWLRLPVGLSRPTPRHAPALWVRGTSLIMSGGCTPGAISTSHADKCYSDVWELDVNGLMQGGKRLNVTGTTFRDERALAGLLPGVERSAEGAKPKGAAAIEGATTLRAAEGAAEGAAALANATSGEPASANATNATTGGGVVKTDDGAALYIEESMEKITPEHIPSTLEAACQYISLERCEQSRLLDLSPAGASHLAVDDTTKFVLGRYVRINPGAINEEDSQIVGFGERLQPGQHSMLRLAAQRNAAENAKESASSAAAHAEAPHAAHPKRTAISLMQMASRATALLPPTILSSFHKIPSFGHGRAEPRDLPGAATLLAKDSSSSAAGSGLPHDAYDRVHGRALHRAIDLVQPLRFAHHGGEKIIQLPESTTTLHAAPAMTHSGARDFLVHRQYELAPPPSPPEESAAERRARLSKPMPPPSPPLPPQSPPPEAHAFVAEDLNYRYDADDVPVNTAAAASLSYARGGPASRLSRVTASRAYVYELANEAPMSWWVGGAAMFGLCMMLAFCICARTRARRRRRRAQLEDVQAVFHTETWRKLE